MHATALVFLFTVLGAAEPDSREPGQPGAIDRPADGSQREGRGTPSDVGVSQFDLGTEDATHVEAEPLDIKFESLTSLRLHPDGDLLACDGQANQIKVISPDGRLRATIPLTFGPEAIDAAPEGTIYCGGEGQLVAMDKSGKALHEARSPADDETDASEARRKHKRAVRVSGIAVSGDSVFVAFGAGWSLGSKSKLFRFDRRLNDPVLLAEGLRGCCQRCDIVARDGVLYLAENSAHRVVAYARSGETLGKWGERSRTELEGFGSCCNPMNLCFGADGALYTAESGLGRVKRYTTDGKYLGLVGYVGVERFTQAGGLAASCSNIAIDVTADGKTVYVMDFKNNKIRVLRQKD